MSLSTKNMSNYIKNLETVKDKISGSAEAQPGTKAGGERYRRVSFPFCVYNSVITTLLSPLGDNLTALPCKAPCRVLARRIVVFMRVATLSLPTWKNFGVNCAVFWRKRGKALHYFNTLAVPVTILSFRLVVL